MTDSIKIFKKVFGLLLLFMYIFFMSCEGQKNSRIASNLSADKNNDIFPGKAASEISKNINSVFQDKKGNFWFGTNGQGVYRYDGKSLHRFSDKDGLCANSVWTIQEDLSGNLWFNTSGGLCRFNGKSFANFTPQLKSVFQSNLLHKKGDLFFSYNGELYRFDGKSFSNFIIYPTSYRPNPANLDRPYGTYCTFEDSSGRLWFGTDGKGVCCYDGKSFIYFAEKGLGSAAVRSIFEDKNGRLWFGNNGYGLFCYDGKTLRNFTDEKQLGNPAFLKKANAAFKPQNLARVWAINEDPEGKLWIGTIDAGVWCYDGKTLKNYTVKDGLTSNVIQSIYKDKSGELWFITDKEGICKFNGKLFTKVVVK